MLHNTPSGQLRFENLLDRIAHVAARAEIRDVLLAIANEYGLKNVAYFGVGLPKSGISDPYLAVTYPDDWITHYKSRRYVECDPVLRQGFAGLLPINWAQIATTNSKVAKLFGEAREFGVGRFGMTIPVRGIYGERALLTITSEETTAEWDRVRWHYWRDFQAFAVQVHEMILRVEGIRRRPVALSARERECLQWISEGKTASECATILSLSERTARFYLENARAKLGAVNNAHAVAKASSLSLLVPRV